MEMDENTFLDFCLDQNMFYPKLTLLTHLTELCGCILSDVTMCCPQGAAEGCLGSKRKNLLGLSQFCSSCHIGIRGWTLLVWWVSSTQINLWSLIFEFPPLKSISLISLLHSQLHHIWPIDRFPCWWLLWRKVKLDEHSFHSFFAE